MKKKLIMLLFISGILIAWYLTASAEPTVEPIGPPTIETHLARINSNMQLIKWIGGILIGLVGVISSLVVFIFMSTVSNLKESIKITDNKAKKALEKTDIIEKDFLSVESFKLIMAGKDK
jgi:hypothetical protein